MGWRMEEDEEWGDEGSTADENDEWLDEREEPTVPCPCCGREIYEDSPQCPHCRQYISEQDALPSRKPWWIIIGVLLCILVIWFWIAYQL